MMVVVRCVVHCNHDDGCTRMLPDCQGSSCNHDQQTYMRLCCVQILNLENFQISMYSVIRASSYASSMYWLAWIVIGKFIFLTLFLAVTLDAFERKYEVRLLIL